MPGECAVRLKVASHDIETEVTHGFIDGGLHAVACQAVSRIIEAIKHVGKGLRAKIVELAKRSKHAGLCAAIKIQRDTLPMGLAGQAPRSATQGPR